VAFAFFGEPLAALPGHECLAAAFGFFLTADAVDVGGVVPFAPAIRRGLIMSAEFRQ